MREMFQRTTWMCATALALCSPLLQAQAEPAQRQDETSKRATAQSVDALIEQLGDADFQVRKAATKELVSRGAAAAADLRAAAEDHDDAEVKMRARRILERIEAGDDEKRVGDGSRLRPRQRAQDPQANRPDASRDPGLRDLRAEIDEMRARIEEMMGGGLFDRDGSVDDIFESGAPFHFGLPQFAPDFVAGQSVRIDVGPDRVRVEIEAKEGSDKESEVYEAPDMESFRAQHPEIAERYFGGGQGARGMGGQFFLDLDGQQPRLRALQRPIPWQMGSPFGLTQPRAGTPNAPAPQDLGAPPSDRRLGVFIDALDPAVAEFLGFDAGDGLRVASVEAGSLAEQMGVEVGDVLLRLGGKQIGQRADVAAALGEIEAGAKVDLVVNRRGREVELSGTKAAVADGERGEKKAERARGDADAGNERGKLRDSAPDGPKSGGR